MKRLTITITWGRDEPAQDEPAEWQERPPTEYLPGAQIEQAPQDAPLFGFRGPGVSERCDS